jgi:hypothetical protein
VHAATHGGSFAAAAEILAEQAELSIPAKRLWRAVKRIGEERVAEQQSAERAYQELPLPAQQQSPVEQVPQVACVQMDGGRLQIRDRHAEPAERAASASYWKELKAGVLLSMQSQVREEDPCPELPATFVDPGKMAEIAREIKGFTSDVEPAARAPEAAEEPTEERSGARPGKPEPVVRSVVALVGDVAEFGLRLASAAHARGFHAAPRKAFVADGAEANWGVHRRHFSHYTPIVDFVHALMYVYAGAMAGSTAREGWSAYRQWAQWLWSGQVEHIIAALTQRQQQLGLPEGHESGTPRAQVAETLRYLTNQRSRMKYDEYRRQGLPITSNYIESTIKQINCRMKGTEKFWSIAANAMLALVADKLSQTQPIPAFWCRRHARLTAPHCYHQTA